MIRIDIKLTDIRIAQFDLLSNHFGQWSLQNDNPHFSDPTLNDQWNKNLKELSRLKEQQEAMARKLMFNMKGPYF